LQSSSEGGSTSTPECKGGRASYLERLRCPFQYPRSSGFRRHILYPPEPRSGKDITKRDKLAVGVPTAIFVVWSMRGVPPNRLTSLETEQRSAQGTASRGGAVKKTTFIHMLALPAQLVNNFFLSLREKNRSKTFQEMSCITGLMSPTFKEQKHTIGTDSVQLYRIFHLSAQERGHRFRLTRRQRYSQV
jgi:hypothetical protein